MHALLLAVTLSAAPAAPAAAAAPSPVKDVYSLSAEDFTATAKRDLKTLRMFIGGMRAVFDRAKKNKKLFTDKANAVLAPEDKATLLSTWGTLFAYFSATEGLRQKYWNFVFVPLTDERHAWGFLITHTALTALLDVGLNFADLALNNKQMEVLLDEPNGEYGVPRDAFANFKLKAIHVATSTQLMTGDFWARTAGPLLKRGKAMKDTNVSWAWGAMSSASKGARSELMKRGVKLFPGNAADIAKDKVMDTVFPVQKDFAEWMGDTRVARNGKPLITKAQVEAEVLPRLEPGDVMVTRQNWFLSNIGLPGFWPHALLYAGTAADLSAYFDGDPEVQAWTKAQKEQAPTFSELLKKRYAAKWKSFAGENDFQGHGPIRVIESISEGVSFTAIEHAFGVDYLGVMRPRLSKLEKAKAIEHAFRYQGRPYDFDFDFFSDSTLVCTELVYKSYQPSKDQKGISLDLVSVAGRATLPANEIVRRFDAEAEQPNRQLDFVLFLDGQEHKGSAVMADEKAFRGTWQRLKWDVAQK